ncbi:MAG: 3-deoxy-manno-octulosonate cytidylyltransferase [Bacteroidales bacterium]|nr:3-deoxy-manno-octulosonate cytidylyltransferase [Bacteroidales bacterium]
MANALGIIPARYASTRFPGKPLADIEGRPMIQWVYEGAVGTHLLDRVIVATDDRRIADTVQAFGGEVALTSANHRSGTDRAAEVARSIDGSRYDVIVNIQGDEPAVNSAQLQALLALFNNPGTEIGTLCKRIDTAEELISPNVVKVVRDSQGRALYFSRYPIPYCRDNTLLQQKLSDGVYMKHIGIYAYRPDTLRKVAAMQPSSLELAESLEQLRWLQAGINIYTAETDTENISIDTPQDLHDFIKTLHP